MGRFYKTASPQMVDFMYKIPEQALYKAIEGVDKQIDTEYLYKTEAEKLLQKKALSPDEQEQKEILEGYQKGIDEVSQLLSTSSLSALKDKQRIRDLQSKIYQDVTRGKLAAQYANYDIRAKHYAEELKRATDKDGNIRIEDVNRAMAEFDRKYAEEKKDEQGNIIEKGGVNYNPVTGKYRSYSPEKLVNFYDKKEEFEKIAKDWKPSTDTDITKEKLVGNYYVTTREKDKLLPINELTWGIYNTALYDQKATSYNDQQIKLLGQGNEKLTQEAFTRLYGERVDPMNRFSPFKMEEVKDAEGKTVMQKVKKIKDGKEVEEEVPVTRMANPGELFLAAQAAADKQDIKEIVRSETLDLTEAAKMQLDISKEKQLRDDEERRKALEKVTFNNNNAEVKEIVIAQKNNKEARAALDDMKSNTIKSVTDKGLELINVINNSNKPAKEKERLLEQLKNIMKPLEAEAKDLKTLDFSALKNFLVSNKITGAGDVATGIDGLSESYNQSAIDYKNKNEHYMALYNISKPKDFNKSEQGIKDIEAEVIKLYNEYERLSKKSNNLRTVADTRAIKDAFKKYEEEKKKLETAKTKHQELISTWNKDFDAKLDYNNKDGGNSNTTVIFSSGGSGLDKVLPQNVFTGFVNALTSITAGNLFPHLLSGTNSVVVTKGKSEPISFNKLLENNNINTELFSTLKDGEKIEIEGGKTMTLNLGSTRVVPGDAKFMVKDNNGQVQEKKIGRGSLQVTLTIYNPKTEKTEISEIYIPKDEVSNDNLRAGSNYLEKHYEPNDIKNKAHTQFGALSKQQNWTEEQKENYKFTFNGGLYYPHKDKWVFDNDPTVPKYDEAALAYYRNIKGYK
jgi:uncharacterized OsmC-like protein